MADLITLVNLIPVPPGSLAEQGGGSAAWPAPGGASSFLPVKQGDTLRFGNGGSRSLLISNREILIFLGNHRWE